MRIRAWSRSTILVFFSLFCFLGPGTAWAQDPGDNHANLARPSSAGSLEDWNSLSLAGSPLHAEPPLLGEKDNFPQYTRELIQVKWRFGDPIDLYVIRPKGVAKPPVILYLYTYPSETERFRNDHFCMDATRNGFAAVGFVSALTGHRYNNRPMKQWFVSELHEALVKSVHDVQMIVNYLSARDDLDTSQIAMFGEGSGGTIAILAAATDPRIKFVDVLDPWGDWPDWMAKSQLIPEQERPSYVKPDFLKEVAPLDPVDRLPQFTVQRVRIQQVMDDPVTPKIAKQRIESSASGRAQVIHYDNTQEFFRAVTGGRLFQWMKDQIQPAPSPQRATQSGHGFDSTQVAPGRNDE
jgi:hypothetical protein